MTENLRPPVLLVDSDPHTRAARARVLMPFADVAVSGSADSALESIEAGARFEVVIVAAPGIDLPPSALHFQLLQHDHELAQRMLVLAAEGLDDDEREYLAEQRLPVLHVPERPRQLTLLVRALLANASRRPLYEVASAAHG